MASRYQPDAMIVEYRLVISRGARTTIRLVRNVTMASEPLTIDLDKDAVVDLTRLHRAGMAANSV